MQTSLRVAAATGGVGGGLTAPLLAAQKSLAGAAYASDDESDWDSSDDSEATSHSDSDDDSSTDTRSEDAAPEAPVPPLQRGLIAAVVGAGVLLPAAAMVAAPTVAVCVAGAFCIALAPVVGRNQGKIARSKGLRGQLDKVQGRMAALRDEVDDLRSTVDDLDDNHRM